VTPKRVLAVDFSELTNVEIRCSSCATTVTIPLPKTKLPVDFNCPGCNRPLWGNETEYAYKRLEKFLELLSEWQPKEGGEKPEEREFVVGFTITEKA
jgi:hypothetical protein